MNSMHSRVILLRERDSGMCGVLAKDRLAIARHLPAACRQAMVRLEVCRRMSARPAEALGRLFFVHAAELRFVYSNLVFNRLRTISKCEHR
jgi:hypothetical protein